jgi:hypothetical protein
MLKFNWKNFLPNFIDVKGQGLAKLLAEENCKLLEINLVSVHADNVQSS